MTTTTRRPSPERSRIPPCHGAAPTTCRCRSSSRLRPSAGPASTLPGAVVAFRLQLQSMRAPSVPLDPCLPYRERLVNHRTQVVLVEEDHLVNCDSDGAPQSIGDPQSRRSTYFDLRLAVPPSAPPGDYDLVWQSVLKPVNARADDLI